STGKLQLNGNNVVLNVLNTNATTPGSAIVENGVAGTATLTVNASSANAFAGVMQNGAAGTLALTKSGTSTLTLKGVNTYTGATTINGGSLAIGTGGSLASPTISIASTGTFDVSAAGYTIPANQVLLGTGNVVGARTHSNAAARIPPGTDSTKGTP